MSNIILIGFMGSGKSTVGRILADRFELDFVDTDTVIEERTGKSVQQIFAKEGEERFREVEKRVVESVCGKTGQVISAGGGVILKPENARCLKKNGKVVYLRLGEEEIYARTARLSGRPLLAGPDRKARVRELIARRKDLYEAAADAIVDVGEMSPQKAADAIAERLGLS